MSIILKWQSTDGETQEINLNDLINFEKNQFAEFVESLPPQPTQRQIAKAKKMLANINKLEKFATGAAK